MLTAADATDLLSKVLVADPITVVVESVAKLICGFAFFHRADGIPINALEKGAGLTLTDPYEAGRSRLHGFFVCAAIAVIIQSVTAFFDRCTGLAVTSRGPVFATPDAQDCTLSETQYAVFTLDVRGFVDDPIAVIVQVIAHLCSRPGCGKALDGRAALTKGQFSGTDSQTTDLAPEGLIDGAVTVFVEAIAGFVLWVETADALSDSIDAGESPGVAEPETPRLANTELVEFFVHLTVTIIIEKIAALDLRREGRRITDDIAVIATNGSPKCST